MKNGQTVLKERDNPAFVPHVLVGTNDRAVHVDFGTITITLRVADGNVGTIIAEARAYDYYDHPLSMEARKTDNDATVEFVLLPEGEN